MGAGHLGQFVDPAQEIVGRGFRSNRPIPDQNPDRIGGSIRRRLNRHKVKKAGLWTHFSVFEVWDNITEAEVTELEGLFRQIYSKDSRANRLNVQKSFKKLKRLPHIIEKP